MFAGGSFKKDSVHSRLQFNQPIGVKRRVGVYVLPALTTSPRLKLGSRYKAVLKSL